MLGQKPTSQPGRKLVNFPIALILVTAIAAPLPHASAETRTVKEQSSGEISIVPNGVNPSPNWGLDKVGEHQNDGPAYTYPDTTNPVRLYLIDTAVANPGNWIGQNPKITFEGTTLIRSSTDPTTSSQFGHGTRMLSLICDLKAGIAPGTPIKVKNYDVYPAVDGTTTATKLAFAVEDAVAHYQDSVPRIPSVICIASSSSLSGSSSVLKSNIEYAVAEGLTVIVSSGNSGANAASYIPASYGTIPGVICVGASDAADMKISMSNYGTPVNLLAPGNIILVKEEFTANVYATMTGTSPAAALVAGSALAELSINGSLSPAQVEARLIASATPSNTSGSPPVLRTTPMAAATIAMPDGPITNPSSATLLACVNFPANVSSSPSGETPIANASVGSDILQVFYGVAEPSKITPSISVTPQNGMEFTFPVDFSLLNPLDLFTLRNGYAWRIRCSGNLDSWNVAQGFLYKKTAPDGTVWLTAKIPVTAPSCFLRIEVADTSEP